MIIKKKIEKGIWDILERILTPDLFNELCKDMGDKYGYYRGELLKQLNRTKTEFYKPGKKPKKETHAVIEYIKWVQILHFVYKIPWEHFDVTRQEVYDDKYRGESKIQWLRNEDGYRLTGKPFKEAYLYVCEDALEKVQNSLWLYDYLGKTSFKDLKSLDAYHGANSELYTIIESKLRDGFEYVRFLALPLDLSVQLNDSKEGSYYDEALMHFIRLCPFTLLMHIYNCFENYPAIYTNNDPDFKPGFYIAPYTSRTHHFAVLDKKTTFGEYYRWNDQSIVRPDILFLESNNETSELLAEVYDWELNRLMKTPRRKLKLHPDKLKKLSQQVFTDVQKKYKALEDDPDNQYEDDGIVYAKNELNAVLEKHQFIQYSKAHSKPK